jgi:TRAP-type mannitol/chloroaromatic compound transport system substrate-binding protein
VLEPPAAELYKPYNIGPIPCGNVGVQVGGWYRKEIKTVEDLKGLKFRHRRPGRHDHRRGSAWCRSRSPAARSCSALEKGTIDAAERVGPHDDEKLGLNKVARFDHDPGWWEGSAQITLLVSTKAWEALLEDPSRKCSRPPAPSRWRP